MVGGRTHAKVGDRMDDVIRIQGNVLNTSTTPVVHELLDLALALAVGRFVDGELDLVSLVCDHNRTERAVLRVDNRVVHGPELMEAQNLLVILHRSLHLAIRLVPHDVIDELKSNRLATID
jgi:hypothetical protein